MRLWLFVVAGVLAGGGVLLIFGGVFARAVPLAVLAGDRPAGADRPRRPAPALEAFAGDAATIHARDLAVCERSVAKFASDRIVNAAVFAFLPFVALVLSASRTIDTSPLLLLIVTVAAGPGGWWYTTPALKRSAEEARKDFEDSLATYFELVSLAFAGGKGAHEALRDPASIGTGPAFRRLRSAMHAGDERREAPWHTLIALGERLGVQSLIDLGTSITLASDGAPVVESLRAKADTMREHALATQEARAEARSETMGAPIVLMFCGFLILFGYPALAGLLALR